MKFFRFKLDVPKVNLYPIVCWHLGSRQSSAKLIAEVLKRIKSDPLARWIYMGDAGECITKTSRGNIYEQLTNPGDQLREAASLLTPIKEKGLFGIRGNHGNRIDKDSGIGWDEMLCARIGIPYMGVSAFGSLILSPGTKHNPVNRVTLYTHHGSAGAISAGGKMHAGHKPEQLVEADIALTAHTHACGECWPARHLAYISRNNKEIQYRTMRMYVCGSAYDSRSGYAEEKQYPVILPEHLVVKISLVRDTSDGKDVQKVSIEHERICVDF